VTRTWITVCDTCKREGWEAGSGAPTDGESLAVLVELAAASDETLAVRRHSCLMGCTRACNVAVQAQGKLCYTLGAFEPTAEAAQAIRAWALLHADSPTGVVPYRQWPEGVKGHFVTRHLPLPPE
jgi:predicted metal-binding protein